MGERGEWTRCPAACAKSARHHDSISSGERTETLEAVESRQDGDAVLLLLLPERERETVDGALPFVKARAHRRVRKNFKKIKAARRRVAETTPPITIRNARLARVLSLSLSLSLGKRRTRTRRLRSRALRRGALPRRKSQKKTPSSRFLLVWELAMCVWERGGAPGRVAGWFCWLQKPHLCRPWSRAFSAAPSPDSCRSRTTRAPSARYRTQRLLSRVRRGARTAKRPRATRAAPADCHREEESEACTLVSLPEEGARGLRL